MRARDRLGECLHRAGRSIEVLVVLAPDQATLPFISAVRRAALSIMLRWDGRNPKDLIKCIPRLQENRQLGEIVLRLSPQWVESLESTLYGLADSEAPSVSLQMEYARRWSLYEYYVMQRTFRRLIGSGWRVGNTRVYLGEPMCRKAPGTSYCGAGMSKVAIASDGTLYPCHRFVTDRTRAIGTAELGFWPGVLRFWRYRADQNMGCAGCPLVPRCDTGCIWLNLSTNGRMDQTTSAVCEFSKMVHTL